MKRSSQRSHEHEPAPGAQHQAAANEPRVSVLLPCYNGALYLKEALESVRVQTFTDFEIIFVNDGSRDGSADIAADFAGQDRRMVIVDKENGGIVSALNAGLAVARGSYVARMDADDVCVPDRFAAQVAYLDAHPRCVVVGGFAVDDPAEINSKIRTSGRIHRSTDLHAFPPKVASALHPLIMTRRNALLAIGGYREGFTHAEDYDLYIRLRAFGTIDNPRKHMLFYRRHEAAVSICNLEIQEESAARSEYDAMQREGIELPPSWLAAPYLRLRIWRRYQKGAPGKALSMRMLVVSDLFSVKGCTLSSRRYWGLRLRILAALFRQAIRAT